ncbi:branched-chain amino acid ABC transporter permease [uncultured Cohaesibacter sp.]|uniref:branched-chain amino acid ABC transporter permease n=1 Tax=uncultured Cohaesibacter sp. TaxID=1002546 RepID=UPI0029C973BC|nr:branched-chain amino acid ABC transporter permease [uncultured Cohaesibacter sp.]
MEFLIIQGLINGVVIGVIYSLIGVGLNIIFGVLRVVNFAHGEVIILGSYLAYFLFNIFGLSPFLALPIAFVLFGVIGYAAFFVLIRPLRNSDDPEHASLLVMFGLSLILGALMLLAFGADTRSIQVVIEPMYLKAGMVIVPTIRLIALGIALAIAAATFLFLYKTLPGKALRAIVMNRDAVRIVGINLDRMSAGAFGLGLGLAAVSGILMAMIFPAFSPFAGQDYTLIGFIIVVLGGLGHPIGALLGGIIFGLAEQMTTVFASGTVAMLAGLILLVAVILFKPSGLAGKAVRR